MRRIALIAAVLAICAWAPPASARPPRVLIINGAGFGHGVGMSQYGARGMATRGFGHDQILRHYFTGTKLGRLTGREAVRVLLQAGLPVASFSGASAANGRRLEPEVAYGVAVVPGGMELRNAAGDRLALLSAPVRVSGRRTLTLRGVAINGIDYGRYRGELELRAAGSRVDVVNELALDDYVQAVIGGEMPSGWPLEALKAQAVAARTYAITTSAGKAFDQYPDTRSQVYGGATYEDARTRLATRLTRGQVVTYRDRPVATYFFSTSGGRTEDVRHVWGGRTARPWLRGVEDPYDQGSPRHRWTRRMSPQEAGARLAGLVKGSFRGIRVLRRGRSPRVVEAEIVGTEGVTRVSGATLRARFGLPDTWAYFAVVG
jgi:stage II sporulation protein D